MEITSIDIDTPDVLRSRHVRISFLSIWSIQNYALIRATLIVINSNADERPDYDILHSGDRSGMQVIRNILENCEPLDEIMMK